MTEKKKRINVKKYILQNLVKWNKKEMSGDMVCYEITKLWNKEFIKEWNKRK